MKRMIWVAMLSLLGGCSTDAVVAMEDDGGAGAVDAGPGADGGPGGADGGPSADGGPGGSDASTCVDADGDGVTDCDGDCDDADPLTYPGAAEVCGDGIDNACGSDPDPASSCAGIGTYVSTAGDDTTGDGTRGNPVRTIAQGIANAQTIGAPTTVVVAGGTYAETVTLVDGISIQGGFECDALPCSWTHAPGGNETIVDVTGADAVEAGDTITRATRLDDVTLRSDRTGLQNMNGSPLVRRCRIEARQGVSSLGGNPRIESCAVVATNVGVYLEDGGELVSSDVEGVPGVRVRDGALVQHNTVHAAGDTGISIYGTSRVDGNVVNEDAARVGTCDFGFCAGVDIWGGSPEVTNNVVYGMGGPRSAAISVVHGELSVENPVIHSNTLYVSRIPGGTGSINVGISCHSVFGIARFDAVRNNVVIGESAGESYGFYEEDHDSGESCRTDMLENNDFFGVDHVARLWNGSSGDLYTTVADANAEAWANANLSVDPMLDAAHRLQAGSGCVDQGVATGAPSVDRDGQPRPAGSGYDIGADERQ